MLRIIKQQGTSTGANDAQPAATMLRRRQPVSASSPSSARPAISVTAPHATQAEPRSWLLQLSTAQYLLGYSVLGLLLVLSHTASNAFALWGSVRAARKLHAALLTKVLSLPMAFFDTQPLGRLLNRFTK